MHCAKAGADRHINTRLLYTTLSAVLEMYPGDWRAEKKGI